MLLLEGQAGPFDGGHMLQDDLTISRVQALRTHGPTPQQVHVTHDGRQVRQVGTVVPGVWSVT